jgi:hypothetical protein
MEAVEDSRIIAEFARDEIAIFPDEDLNLNSPTSARSG